MKIVIDDKIPYIQGALEAFATVKYIGGGVISNADLKDADALITRTRTKCNKALLEGTQVKYIATATIGFDHIDTAYCKEAGIQWTNAPGCNSGSVLQYIASVFAWLILEKQQDFSKLTVGVVGAGNVGGKVVRLCQTLGIKVLVNDPPRALAEGAENFVSFEEILTQADIITCHVPLNRSGDYSTYHLLNETSLSKLKRKPLIINSSRGEVVETNAIYAALLSGQVSNLVLDVWENEPNIHPQLLEKTVIATPHIAGYSADGKANGSSMSVQAISRFFNLEAKDWKPNDVPAPAVNKLMLDCGGLSLFETFAYIIRFTYDVKSDSDRLKAEPNKFEKFRGNYPVRREFPEFTIELSNCTDELAVMIQKLGFNVIHKS